LPDFIGSDFRFLANEIAGRKSMTLYPLVDALLRLLLRVAVPVAGRL
jgi:hypothetical protein